MIEVTDALDAKTAAFLSTVDGERFSIAERGAITFSLFPVIASDIARRIRDGAAYRDVAVLVRANAAAAAA